eukprot:jgi/Undpi1/3097/HiC_scaffold_15.g06471.m1
MAQAGEEKEEKEETDTSEGESAAAFANVPASVPGRHGTPFIAKSPPKRKEQPQSKRHFARREGAASTTTTPTSTATTIVGAEEEDKQEKHESELPHPEDDPEAINQAIKNRKNGKWGRDTTGMDQGHYLAPH